MLTRTLQCRQTDFGVSVQTCTRRSKTNQDKIVTNFCTHDHMCLPANQTDPIRANCWGRYEKGMCTMAGLLRESLGTPGKATCNSFATHQACMVTYLALHATDTDRAFYAALLNDDFPCRDLHYAVVRQTAPADRSSPPAVCCFLDVHTAWAKAKGATDEETKKNRAAILRFIAYGPQNEVRPIFANKGIDDLNLRRIRDAIRLGHTQWDTLSDDLAAEANTNAQISKVTRREAGKRQKGQSIEELIKKRAANRNTRDFAHERLLRAELQATQNRVKQLEKLEWDYKEKTDNKTLDEILADFQNKRRRRSATRDDDE